MPRKTKEESERTRQRVLEVALEVFSEKGYVQTSLQEIATRAGFTRGAVYWHFKNKVDLFMALAKEVESSLEEEFLANGLPETRDDLKRTLCGILSQYETDERLRAFQQIIEYRTEWVEELSPLFDRFRHDLRGLAQWIVMALSHLSNRGQVDDSCDSEADGLALYVHFMGLYTIGMTDPSVLSLTKDAPRQIERFLDKLAPRASQTIS